MTPPEPRETTSRIPHRSPEEIEKQAAELDDALGGGCWQVLLENGELLEITSRDLLFCLDRVCEHHRRHKSPVPDTLHPLIPALRTALGVPPGEGTLPMLLISLLRSPG